MKKLLLFMLAALAVNVQNTFSWDSDAARYMPLQVGNVWVYNCTSYGMACNCSMIYRYKVISSVNKNGKIYFIFQVNSFSGNCWNGCMSASIYDSLRVDLITGNVYKYSAPGCLNSPLEKLQDSLNARLDDTVKNDCGVSQYKYICYDTSNIMLFGNSVKTKGFHETQFETGYGRKYAEGFGIISSGYGSIICTNNSLLKGCIINGILYGDTSTFVGINQISTEAPNNHTLTQNYPNPFNPSTIIKFQIPKSGFVNLTVFDVLGKEVQTLVNQQLSPGTYSVDFDGSTLPSGIYYYRLESGSFTETKKMVLIK
jgi:hypothetical protein